MRTISAARLTDLVALIMQGGGCNAEEARTVARRLVDSNLVGHDSHGVLRVGKYLEWARDGKLRQDMIEAEAIGQHAKRDEPDGKP